MNSPEYPRLDFLERLDKVLVYRRGEQRAPHKPLYLLYCLASLQQRLPRLQKFEIVSKALAEALSIFGLHTKTLHPEYPFWRLQHDNLAVVETDGPLDFRESSDDPKRSSLLRNNARGGFRKQDYDLLVDDIKLQSIAVHKLLDAHFPASIHDEIIRHFNLILKDPHTNDTRTEKEFRNGVLSAYGNSCALTGFSLKFGGNYAGVEAAHICWPQAGGNDEVCNGIAMSTLHRKLFHLGLFTIDQSYQTQVSPDSLESLTANMSLKQLQGVRINLPLDSRCWPSLKALAWHARWVYRG